MKMVIYGAQAIAFGLYKAIHTLFPDKKVDCFLVTEKSYNESLLGGLAVRELKEFVSCMSQEEKDDIEVLIAVPENLMNVIEQGLEQAGLYHYVRMTSHRWANMIKSAFIKSGEYIPLSVYPIGVHKVDLKIFKMIHKMDKVLQVEFADPEYFRTVQVGSILSDKRQANYYDDTGDNISGKNKNYSELTGLYWMWKNQILTDDVSDSYYGLAHYRRYLHLTEDDLLRIIDNDIDAVLPYPMPYEPNIEAHHERYLSSEEWNSVLIALKELQPMYAEALQDIMKQEYLFNYNIIIAKKDILNDYCNWLFPILFRVEELNSPRCIENPNRFIGYIGETLGTLYFMYNERELTIAYSECRFLL